MSETFFERVHKQDTHTPDVLSCLANLSNDEVFTPPDLVNQVLDLLPQELFKDPNAKFLDPATKTGISTILIGSSIEEALIITDSYNLLPV